MIHDSVSSFIQALRNPLGVRHESPIQFHKSSQLLIRTHNETLSVVAMRVCNPDRSTVGEFACDFVSSRGTSGSGGSPKNETASSQTRNKVSCAFNLNCIAITA